MSTPHLCGQLRGGTACSWRWFDFLLTLDIPELSYSLPWLNPHSSSQGGLPYSWGRSYKEWLQGPQASHVSLAPAFQPFLCIGADRQVMRPLQIPGRRPRISEPLVAGLPILSLCLCPWQSQWEVKWVCKLSSEPPAAGPESRELIAPRPSVQTYLHLDVVGTYL